MSAMDPSSNGSTSGNGAGPPPRLRTRSAKPHRLAAGSRIVVTRIDQPAETHPASEPTWVEPRPPAPARTRLEPSPAPPKSPLTPAPPSPSDAGTPPAPVGANFAAPQTDGADRPEWCSIVFAATPDGGEFQVLAVAEGGRRKVVARSEPFRTPLWRIPPLRRLPNLGAPRRAHDLLVKRLVALGWQQMPTRGRWHDTALVRTRLGPKPDAQDR